MFKEYFQTIWQAVKRKKNPTPSTCLKTELRRCLSTFDLTLIGIGGTIGAGIYVLTGEVAKTKTGPGIMISFLIAAFVSLLSGLCFAELGAKFPRAGSVYYYCYVYFGEFVAFLCCWNMIFYEVVGGSVIARALSDYIDSLIGGSIKKGTQFLLGSVNIPLFAEYMDIFSFTIALFFTCVVLLGIKDSARLNMACVLTNVITILLVIFVGFAYGDIKNWTSNFTPYGISGVVSGSAVTFFSLIGFDGITTMGEEAKNPSKSIPLSLVAAILFCAFAYIGVAGAVTMMVPYDQLDTSAAVSVAFEQKGLEFMRYIIGIGASLGIAGNTLITIIVVPRQVYSFAQDGMILKTFSRVNHTTGVPSFSITICGILMGLLGAILNLDSLAESFSGGILISYSLVCLCVLAERFDSAENKYRVQDQHVNQSDDKLGNQSCSSSKEHSGGTHPSGNKRLKESTRNIIFFLILTFSIILSLAVKTYSSSTNIRHNYLGHTIVSISSLLIILLCLYLFASLPKKSPEETETENHVIGNPKVFKVPLVPWLPVLAIICNSFLMVSLTVDTWLKIFVWLGIGFFVYFGYSMKHSSENEKNAKSR